MSEIMQKFLDTLNYKQKAYWKVLEEEIGGEIPAHLKYILHKFDYTTIGGWTLFELSSDITMMEIHINETDKDDDPELTWYDDIADEVFPREQRTFSFSTAEVNIIEFIVRSVKKNGNKLIERYCEEVKAWEEKMVKTDDSEKSKCKISEDIDILK